MFDSLKEIIFPKTAGTIFGLPVNESVVSGFLVVALVSIFAVIVRIFFIPKFKFVPSGFQLFLEWIVGIFSKMSKSLTKFGKLLGPFCFAAATYICFGVLIELFGYRPAIADLNAGYALALSTFVLLNVFALKQRKLKGRIKYYFEPVFFVAPVKFISEISIPFSMTFRLFGSILSGLVIMELLYIVLWWIPIAGILSLFFTVFHAVIQAYIFTMLSLVFIAEATE